MIVHARSQNTHTTWFKKRVRPLLYGRSRRCYSKHAQNTLPTLFNEIIVSCGCISVFLVIKRPHSPPIRFGGRGIISRKGYLRRKTSHKNANSEYLRVTGPLLF